MSRYRSVVARARIGTVKVKTSALEFSREARESQPKSSEKLMSIYERKQSIYSYDDRDSCGRDNERHHLTAIISPTELRNLLGSKLNRDLIITENLNGQFPFLNTEKHKIRCHHGRQRIEAAEAFFQDNEEEKWWPVTLYCFKNKQYEAMFYQEQTEFCSDERGYSDGFLYRKIRFHQMHEEPTRRIVTSKKRRKAVYSEENPNAKKTKIALDLVEIWKLRLSNSKRRSISAINNHEVIQTMLDKLAHDFPALLEDLELTNIPKHFSRHCDDNFKHYLDHMYKTWKEITQLYPIVLNALDVKTVKALQLRAPAKCSADRDYIIRAMENESLFSKLTDANMRDNLKCRILELQVVIPTIKSLHKNMLYFQIGADIIRDIVLPNLERWDRDKSLFEIMKANWRQPDETMIEIREGEFKRVKNRVGGVKLAYIQVFISTLRQFDRLCNICPMTERGKEVMAPTKDPAYVLLCLKRVDLVGFTVKTDKIAEVRSQTINLNPSPSSENLDCASDDRLDQRWGRPGVSRYKRLRNQLFLPQLLKCESLELFVARDFIDAFLGLHTTYYTAVNSLVGPVVSLIAPVQEQPYTLLSPHTTGEGDIDIRKAGNGLTDTTQSLIWNYLRSPRYVMKPHPDDYDSSPPLNRALELSTRKNSIQTPDRGIGRNLGIGDLSSEQRPVLLLEEDFVLTSPSTILPPDLLNSDSGVGDLRSEQRPVVLLEEDFVLTSPSKILPPDLLNSDSGVGDLRSEQRPVVLLEENSVFSSPSGILPPDLLNSDSGVGDLGSKRRPIEESFVLNLPSRNSPPSPLNSNEGLISDIVNAQMKHEFMVVEQGQTEKMISITEADAIFQENKEEWAGIVMKNGVPKIVTSLKDLVGQMKDPRPEYRYALVLKTEVKKYLSELEKKFQRHKHSSIEI